MRRRVVVGAVISVTLGAICWFRIAFSASQNPPQATTPALVIIGIGADGKITWNGQTMTNRAQLDQMLSRSASQSVQPEIQLRPAKLAKYHDVYQVLADAQRAGLYKFGIVGNEEYFDHH